MEYITAKAQPTPKTKPRKTPIKEETVKDTPLVYQRGPVCFARYSCSNSCPLLNNAYQCDAGAEENIFSALWTVWVRPHAVGRMTIAQATATRTGEDLVGTCAAITLSSECFSGLRLRTGQAPHLSTSIFR